MLIEGVGDEVVLFAALVLLIAFLALAWISTGVAEQQINVILIDRRSFQRLVQRLLNRFSGQWTAAVNHAPATTEQEANSDGATSSATTNESEPSAVPSDNLEDIIPPLEELLDVNSERNNERLLPIQIVGMSHMEDLLSTNDSEESSPGTPVNTQGGRSSEQATDASDEQPTPENDTVAVEQDDATNDRSETEDDDKQQDCEDVDPQQTLRQRKTTASIDQSQQESPCEQNEESAAVAGVTAQTEENVATNAGNSTSSTTEEQRTAASEEQEEDITLTPEEGFIRIRLKYLDDRQRWVQAKPEHTIAQFKRTHFADELSNQHTVRFIFNGQELVREASTLASYNIIDNDTTIHCLLSRQPSPNNTGDSTNNNTASGSRAAAEDDVFDIGQLMMPLCGLVLGVGWYCRLQYRAHFSAAATMSLVGLTVLFIMFLLAASWNAADNNADRRRTTGDPGLNDLTGAELEGRRQGIRTRVHRIRI